MQKNRLEHRERDAARVSAKLSSREDAATSRRVPGGHPRSTAANTTYRARARAALLTARAAFEPWTLHGAIARASFPRAIQRSHPRTPLMGDVDAEVGARTLPSQTHHHRPRQRMRHNLPRRELTRGRASLTIVRPHARDVKLSIPSLGAPPRRQGRPLRTRRDAHATSPVSRSSSSDRFVSVVPPRTPLVATRSHPPVSSRTVLDSRVPRRRAPSARPRARASIARARTSRTTPADARAIHPPRRRRVRAYENGPLSLSRASSPPTAPRARARARRR